MSTKAELRSPPMPSDEIIETMARAIAPAYSDFPPPIREVVIAALSAAEAAGWVMVPVALVEQVFPNSWRRATDDRAMPAGEQE